MLYKRLIINGEEYLLAVNQTGRGAPSETTVGEPGVLYMNLDTGAFYKCTSVVNGVHTWVDFGGSSGVSDTQIAAAVNDYLSEHPVSAYTLPVGGTELGGVKNGGNVTINADGTMDAPDLSQGANQGGLSSDEKTLIANLFDNVAFERDDMPAAVTQLKNLFNGGKAITYAVTYNLTDVSTDNDVTTVKAGFPYTATLTIADGMELNMKSLAVIMSGENITDTVYSDGVISIPCVTGEISITAETREEGLVYDLGKETVQDGTAAIDTGVYLFDTTKTFSIMLEFTCSAFASVFNVVGTDNYAFRLDRWGDGNWYVETPKSWRNNLGFTAAASNTKVIIVWNTSSRNGTAYVSNAGSDMAVVSLGTNDWSYLFDANNTLKIDAGPHTIHSFKVYEKALDETTINEFMGVA